MQTLFRLIGLRIRRDWLQIVLWTVGAAALSAAAVAGVQSSFATDAERQGLLLTVFANPVILLFRGLPSGAAEAPFTLFLIFPFLAMLAGFMSTFLSVRHTRADEETGRLELLATAGAGRLMPLLATIIHGLGANLLYGLAVAVTFLGLGFDAAGSWISGAGAAAVGVSFLGVGLVAAQIMPTPRAANSISVWVLLLSYLLAGLGNALGTADLTTMSMQSTGLVWFTPFGWGEQIRPFADNLVGPAVLAFGFGLVLAGLSLVLQSTRDLGQSLVPERGGRMRAPRLLRSSFGLSWRLSRSALIGWAVGGLLAGALSTSLASVLQDAVTQSPQLAEMLTKMAAQTDLTQATVVIFFSMVGILASAAGVQMMTKARQEESHGRAELVLTSKTSRVRWLAGWIVVGAFAAVATVAGAVVGAAAGISKQTDPQWSLLFDAVVLGAGQLLAATVFLVVVALVFVLIPRFTIGLGWSLLLVGMIIGMFGSLLGFPQWVIDLAPISSAPTISGDTIELHSGVGMLIFVLVGVAVALGVQRRREMITE